MTVYERQGMLETVRSSGLAKKMSKLNERASFVNGTLVCVAIATTGRSVSERTQSQPFGTFPFHSMRFSSTTAGSLRVLKAFVISFYSMDREQTNICPEFLVTAEVFAPPNQKLDSAYGPENMHHLAGGEATEALP